MFINLNRQLSSEKNKNPKWVLSTIYPCYKQTKSILNSAVDI